MVTTNEKPIYADIAIAQLGVAIGTTETTLALVAGHGAQLPSPGADEYAPAMLRVRTPGQEAFEAIEITNRTGDSVTVRRGIGGTAMSFPAGAEIYLAVHAGELDASRRTLRAATGETGEVMVAGVARLVVDAVRTTSAGPVRLPSMTTAERNAYGAQVGDLILNSDGSNLQIHTEEGWLDVTQPI